MKASVLAAALFASCLTAPAAAIVPAGQGQVVNQEAECPEGQTFDDEQQKCVPAE